MASVFPLPLTIQEWIPEHLKKHDKSTNTEEAVFMKYKGGEGDARLHLRGDIPSSIFIHRLFQQLGPLQFRQARRHGSTKESKSWGSENQQFPSFNQTIQFYFRNRKQLQSNSETVQRFNEAKPPWWPLQYEQRVESETKVKPNNTMHQISSFKCLWLNPHIFNMTLNQHFK